MIARQKEREQLIAAIAEAETLNRIENDRPAIEARVHASVGRWQDLLRGSMADARQLLAEVLAEPLQFEPVGKTYRFPAPLKTGELVRGCVARGVSSPTGARDTYEPGTGETYELPLGGTVRKAA